MTEKTPVMKQYEYIKKHYPDSILFFRMGDFYEMFYDDAKVASELLDIALTSREKKRSSPVPMCGVPAQAADGYIAKLLREGYSVAICEQVEEAKGAKGLLKREVVRLITPGSSLGLMASDQKENNFIASVFPSAGAIGFSALDLSTGEFILTELNTHDEVLDELHRLAPRELLLPASFGQSDEAFVPAIKERGAIVRRCEDWFFNFENSYRLLTSQLGTVSLEGYGCQERRLAICAAGALLQFLSEAQKRSLDNINSLNYYSRQQFMVIDACAERNLELTRSMATGSKKGSLLEVLDFTSTAMGGRKLKNWLLQPLLGPRQIEERLEAVAEFVEKPAERMRVRQLLKEVRDIERLMSRVVLGCESPRDLVALKVSIKPLPFIKEAVAGFSAKKIAAMASGWDDLGDIAELLDKALLDEPSASSKEGGLIREGYNAELDHLRLISRDGKSWISELERKEKEETGISSLKVGYNKIFGYYIEVTKPNLRLVPDRYIRKQTLIGCERFSTPELKEYEWKVLSAEERMSEIEYSLYREVASRVAGEVLRVQKMAQRLAELDVLCSLAEAAHLHNYTMPNVCESDVIEIKGGRHPVLERADLGERFVPNDCLLDCTENQVLVITGPNMAGKSTYLRQVALIVIMAQMGSFVPADEARVGVVDRIFTRVGAQDFLIKGQSTFMVEMNETANILNNATSRSLILLDEVGRGTSTYDGLGIAWAVVEYIHNEAKLGARTLFATHFFELTELASLLKRVKNLNFSAREWEDGIIFLRKIAGGGADKSYGLQVARLAGMPEIVINRAKKVLARLENSSISRGARQGYPAAWRRANLKDAKQLPLFQGPEQKVADALRKIDLDNITPFEALKKMAELKELLDGKKGPEAVGEEGEGG